jgi:hypothetical protein
LVNQVQNKTTDIPVRTDGSPYSIYDCQEDQQRVLYYVFKQLQQFVNREKQTSWNETEYLTVAGGAGTGKTTTINTIVSSIRNMFGYKESVLVFAPTGSAAFNAGGQTLQKGFFLESSYTKDTISQEKHEKLVRKIGWTFMIIIDERSMLQAMDFGAVEWYCRHALQATGRPNDM